ncbi:MAG: molecular chaperone DnaJ, partial [Pseudomonadota bacterium]
ARDEQAVDVLHPERAGRDQAGRVAAVSNVDIRGAGEACRGESFLQCAVGRCERAIAASRRRCVDIDRRSQRSRAQRGSDLRYNLRVSLEEAYQGVQKTINVPTSIACDTCRGTGAEGGAEPVTCPTCSGMGKVRAQQGFFTVERTCPTCSGMGQIVKNPCRSCGGAGRIEKERSLSVNIPAGVETGTRIRLAGEGEAGLRGGPAGDLYIFIEVRDHAIFQRDGVHLFCRVLGDLGGTGWRG